jgi:hypothetical protein
MLKYIVLPGLNDTAADINGFVQLCKHLEIRNVDIVRDFHNMRPFSDHTIDMVVRMMHDLQKEGVRVSESDNALSVISEDALRISQKLGDLDNAR